MSIYGTWLTIEHPDQWMAEMEADGIGAGVIGDDSDERELGSPLIYQGSHILPHDTDARGGSVEVAAIAGFITRDGRDDGPDDDGVWPYLRLSVNGLTVVLTAEQVAALSDTLRSWIDRVVATA